jgi:soluble lytic murein transglycosylase
MAALAARDYSFLDGVDPSRYGDILKVGPGAPFYLGFHLALAGKDAEARGMYALGAEKCEEPWKSLCLDELTKTGTPSERLEAVRAAIHEREKALGGKGGRSASAKKASKAPEEPSVAADELESLRNLETELAIETGSYDPASRDLKSWFYSRTMTKSLAELVPALPEGLSPEVYGIAASRASVYRRDYGSAWAAAKAILASGASGAFFRPVLSDFGKAALYGSSDLESAAAFFEALKVPPNPSDTATQGDASATDDSAADAPFVCAFYAGRLYSAAAERRLAVGTQAKSQGKAPAKAGSGTTSGSGRKAVAAKPLSPKDDAKRLRALARERFETAFTLARSETDRDTALWYLLKDSANAGMEEFFGGIDYCAARWANPDFFSDILDAFVVERVSARDLDSIVRLYLALSGLGGGETLARIAYLSARSGRLSGEFRDSAYREAFEGDHTSLYYRVMAGEALGLPLADSSSLYRARKVALRKPVDTAEAEKVLSGFIDFKLADWAYPEAQELYPNLPVKLAETLADRMEREGEWTGAIRLMVFALRATGDQVTDADLALVYPRPWLPEVEAAARQYGLPEYLLYAMIRSESLFSPGVHSGAGAVGLTQLMRPTAAEIARRLGFPEYNLEDPATNIGFGAYYLSEMIRRMDGRVLPALFAYNAGINRVRAWQKDGAGLADDLLLESLPYAETREYGRKVLAAAAVYGYLYYQKSPGQVVRELF